MNFQRPELLSNRSSVELLEAAGRAAAQQTRDLLAAGAAGVGFQLGHSVVHERVEVERLAARPVLSVDDLGDLVPGDVALIARQAPRVAVTGDCTRSWMGVDLFAPADEQVLASNRWWHVSPNRMALLERDWARGLAVPFVVSVGGYVTHAYSIVSIDHDISPEDGGKYAFVFSDAAPAWGSSLVEHWLPSGRGGSLVTWRRT